MGTYVNEIIEVKERDENGNEKWVTVKTYRDASNELKYIDNNDIEDGDEFEVFEAKNIKGGDKLMLTFHNHEFVDDNDYQEFLLEVMPTDLGMPEDASEETKKNYESEPNEPSKPSYYTLDELIEHYKTYRIEGFHNLEEEIEGEYQDKVLDRLDYICGKLDNPEIKKGYKGIKDTPDYHDWRLVFDTLMEDIQTLHRNIWRIKTLVRLACPHIYSNKDIRVIWYIV